MAPHAPDVPWRELAGFRNVVVHDYLAIGTERILPIVSRDIPSLKEKLAAILAALRPADVHDAIASTVSKPRMHDVAERRLSRCGLRRALHSLDTGATRHRR